MQTRVRLLHAWTRQLQALLPAGRATRVTTLALATLGLLWAQHVALPRIAAALPLRARDPSTERRLRRWLANPAVTFAMLWTPLLPALLAGIAGPAVVLAFDLTPHGQRFTILSLGVVCHKRVLPLGWRVMPQQTAWPEPLPALFRALATPVQAALPADCVVTVVADRGLVGHKFVDACRALGWHVALRLQTSGGAATRCRLADGREQRVADLPTQPGQRWHAPAAIFKDAGWRHGFLTIRWDRDAREPLVLFSTRPGGTARVREYRRRMLAEASFQDSKSRGWQLERSKLAADRLERLLMPLALAFWWAHGLGLRAIHAGHRRRFDRRDRRDLSVDPPRSALAGRPARARPSSPLALSPAADRLALPLARLNCPGERGRPGCGPRQGNAPALNRAAAGLAARTGSAPPAAPPGHGRRPQPAWLSSRFRFWPAAISSASPLTLLQPPQPEPPQPVPVLGLGEERFDPDLAFAHRLGVGLGRVVAAHPVQVRLVEAARPTRRPRWRGGALGAERAGAHRRRRGLVDPALRGVALGQEAQRLARPGSGRCRRPRRRRSRAPPNMPGRWPTSDKGK